MSTSESSYDGAFERLAGANWLLEHIADEHRIELCQRMPLCELIAWVHVQRRPVTVERIWQRAGCSRATAYRIRAAMLQLGLNVVPTDNRAEPNPSPLLPEVEQAASGFYALQFREPPRAEAASA